MKYDPKYCDMLIKCGEEGLSFERFAAKIRVSRQTIYDWAMKYPEFEEAKELADNLRCTLLEEALIGSAIGTRRAANPISLIFCAKNILGWKDKQTHEMEGDDKVLEINLNYKLREGNPEDPK